MVPERDSNPALAEKYREHPGGLIRTHVRADSEFPSVTNSAESAHPYSVGKFYDSDLVFEEGEVGIDIRSVMTKTNEAIREVGSMAGMCEKYPWINVPIKSSIDRDTLKLCDVWVKIERKGRNLVHHLKWGPYSETLHTEKKHPINFSDSPRDTELREVYNKLTRETSTLRAKRVERMSPKRNTRNACRKHERKRDSDEFRRPNEDCWVTEYHADLNAAVNIAGRLDPWGESLPLKPRAMTSHGTGVLVTAPRNTGRRVGNPDRRPSRRTAPKPLLA